MNSEEEVTVTLTLTRQEWEEVPNALESKARRIEQGEYAGMAESEEDDERWVRDLRSATEKIGDALNKAGVNW